MTPIDPRMGDGLDDGSRDCRPLRSTARWSYLRVDVEASTLALQRRKRSPSCKWFAGQGGREQNTVHAADSRCSCAVLRSLHYGAVSLRMRMTAHAAWTACERERRHNDGSSSCWRAMLRCFVCVVMLTFSFLSASTSSQSVALIASLPPPSPSSHLAPSRSVAALHHV